MTIRNHPRLAVIVALACCMCSCAAPSRKELKSPRSPAHQMKKASVGISKHATKANPDLPVEIRAFYVSIHGGKGCSGYGLYRAKLTLFAVSATPAGVHAELYFYDTLEQMMPDDYSQPHYVLTFPIAALAPILDQLRHSTSQVNLVRENHVWRIETTPGEPVRKR